MAQSVSDGSDHIDICADDSGAHAAFDLRPRRATTYFPLIAQIIPRALTHRYSFVSDEWFQEQVNAGKLTVAQINHFIALDVLEKSHLAAVTSLIRMERWAEAVCLMHDASNFPGFASTLRGLIESGGDTVDGLLGVAGALANYHRKLAQALVGEVSSEWIDCAEIERMLDHYVHAGWTAKRGHPVLTAKPNVDYVSLIEAALPGAVSLYHQLCAIVHPSNASIDWLFRLEPGGDDRLTLAPNDAAKIEALCEAFPDVADVTIQMSCNTALTTLRVLHKFPLHPRIPELKKFDWGKVKIAREVERLLRA